MARDKERQRVADRAYYYRQKEKGVKRTISPKAYAKKMEYDAWYRAYRYYLKWCKNEGIT